jgi:acetyltransferase-like isoleucine patch superfamily enzyme
MKFIKKCYLRICQKIYFTGKNEYENKMIFWYKNKADIHSKAVFYLGSSIINLSNDKSRIVVGSNSHIYGQLTIHKLGGKIHIGNDCSLGENSRIVSLSKITIGDRVMIAHNVNILDNNSHPIDAKDRHIDFLNNYLHHNIPVDIASQEVIIEDDVWIGFNSIILKGVRIGRGAIIGAGSIVTKDIAPWTVNVGNPIQSIKTTETWLDEKN